MRPSSWLGPARLALRAIVLLCSCGGPAADQAPLEELGWTPSPPGPLVPTAVPTAAPERARAERIPVLGRTAQGELCLFDGATGTVLDRAPASTATAIQDVAWDPYRRRALVVEGSVDDDSAEVVTFPIAAAFGNGPTLGPRRHRAWIDGRARLWPAPNGIVLFEEGYGERWKLLRNDGLPTPSVVMPRPASVWSELDEGSLWLGALSYGPPGGAPALRQATAQVAEHGFSSACTSMLGYAPTTLPPTTRLAPLAPSSSPAQPASAVVVDLAGGAPSLRVVPATSHPSSWTAHTTDRFERVEDVAVLPGSRWDGAAVVAALLAEPAQLLVAVLDEASTQLDATFVPLPGKALERDRFFGRDLLALGPDRLLVATDEGVWLARVRLDDRAHAWLERAAGGAGVRGPLAGPLVPAPSVRSERSARPRR